MIISKNSQNWIKIKFEIENGEKVRRKIEIKFSVEKTLDNGWIEGWVGGSQSRVKDCLQQSKILHFDYFKKL